MIADSRVVFSRARAARVAGVSERQLDYWRKTFLLQPTTDEPVSAHRSVRLYSFTDMVAVLTIAQLVEHKIPVQRIRKVVDRLRADGTANPLVEMKFGVYGAGQGAKASQMRMTVRFADGSLESDEAHGQPVISDEVLINLEEIRATLRQAPRRSAADVGGVERRRNTLGSKPVIAGTRIPVETIHSYMNARVPDSEILEAFPALAAEDLDVLRAAV